MWENVQNWNIIKGGQTKVWEIMLNIWSSITCARIEQLSEIKQKAIQVEKTN